MGEPECLIGVPNTPNSLVFPEILVSKFYVLQFFDICVFTKYVFGIFQRMPAQAPERVLDVCPESCEIRRCMSLILYHFNVSLSTDNALFLVFLVFLV